MGYSQNPLGLSLYGTKFARNQKKINKFLMIKNSALAEWLKFPLLPNFIHRKDNNPEASTSEKRRDN
jgi:hypothetical protein